MKKKLRFGTLYFLQFYIAQFQQKSPAFVDPGYMWEHEDLKREYLQKIDKYLHKTLKISYWGKNGNYFIAFI
jgi:hypothetical protein